MEEIDKYGVRSMTPEEFESLTATQREMYLRNVPHWRHGGKITCVSLLGDERFVKGDNYFRQPKHGGYTPEETTQ